MSSGQVVYTPNRNAVTFETVTVVTSGTPVQGPNVAVPDGMKLAVRNRATNTGTPTVFVAKSSADTGNATKRLELTRGEVLVMNINNMNLLWFDSDANSTVVELVVEQ